jgi:putative acetyltransferase
VIRLAGPADHAAIDAVLREAFPTAAEADLVTALRIDGAMLCELVRDGADGMDGYIAASAMQSPAGCAGLGPVAVAAASRGQGHGSALIRAALAALATAGIGAVFVLGAPAYYRRFGFSLDAARRFDTAYPRDFMMALELAPGALAASGTLRYARPFEALGQPQA